MQEDTSAEQSGQCSHSEFRGTCHLHCSLSVPVGRARAVRSSGPQEDVLEREGLHVAPERDTRPQRSYGQRLAWGRGRLRLSLVGLGVRLGASHTPCRVPPASGCLWLPQVWGHVNSLLSACPTPQLTSPGPGMSAPGST